MILYIHYTADVIFGKVPSTTKTTEKSFFMTTLTAQLWQARYVQVSQVRFRCVFFSLHLCQATAQKGLFDGIVVCGGNRKRHEREGPPPEAALLPPEAGPSGHAHA
jgi:hypothetical protein